MKNFGSEVYAVMAVMADVVIGRDQKAAGVGRLNPGSDEAIAAGCTCPVIDNGHGRGCMGGVKDEQGRTVFVIRLDCPLHGIAEEDEK